MGLDLDRGHSREGLREEAFKSLSTEFGQLALGYSYPEDQWFDMDKSLIFFNLEFPNINVFILNVWSP